jgi:CheY-like chemotaxis protein
MACSDPKIFTCYTYPYGLGRAARVDYKISVIRELARMNIYKALDVLEKIETELSSLYLKLHEDHRFNKEAAEFFMGMHEEEEGHAQIVRMERRIVQSSPKAFSEPQLNFSEINSLLESVANLKMNKLELPELVARIYGIESSLSEKYLIDAIKDTNEDLHDFLLQLGDSLNLHADKVAAWAGKLGVNIEGLQNRYLRKARVSYAENVMLNNALSVRGVDISEGGMFLLTGRTFPQGETLSMQFNVLQTPVTAKAKVQFIIDGVGMGVMFEDMAEADRELIARSIAKWIEEKGLEKQKRLLFAGNPALAGQDMRIYVNSLLNAGYKVVDLSGFEETLSFLRKGLDLSCIVLSVETEKDINYYVLQVLQTMDRYKSLPVLVLTNSQKQDFRAALARLGATKLLDKMSASPKRLTEEITALTA